MKDCIKKLIFSFEQQNIGGIDEASTMVQDTKSIDMMNISNQMSVKKSGTAVQK